MHQLLFCCPVLILLLATGPVNVFADCVDYQNYLHLAGSVDTPGFANRVAASGNYACVPDRDGGLQVIDVSNPEQPSLVGHLDIEDGGANCIAVSGTRVFIGTQERLSRVRCAGLPKPIEWTRGRGMGRPSCPRHEERILPSSTASNGEDSGKLGVCCISQHLHGCSNPTPQPRACEPSLFP